MAKTVLDYKNANEMVGIKVAGGIRDSKKDARYLVLIKEEIGEDWLDSNYFRFGASESH